ncbi:nucleotidyltransferase family protein [Pseudomonas saliphila]|uniref:nucleotidyltransferase family protein n=1 Tax=Pseudomonas saliphila TaxID=2586906 RepID=UPI001238B8E5|nr:nucleotidyltransferase family protein [Pseudomonas saliphila]
MTDCSSDVCAIVLAAGQGRRFRERFDVDKLLAPSAQQGESEPVLLSTLRALQGATERLVVVVRQDNRELIAWLDRMSSQVNVEVYPVRSDGLGHSLAQAVARFPARRGWLVALGDMPYVRPDSVQRIAEAIRPDSLIVPVYRGQRGHPRGIGREHRDALLGLTGDHGAQQLFAQSDVVELPVDDPGVLLDIDRPDDVLPHRCDSTTPERSALSRGRTSLKPQ